jgi:hypothetical protein
MYRTIHCKKSTNESEGKPGQKFDAAFRTIFRIEKYIQRSKQKFNIYFPLAQGRQKMYRKY